MQWPALIETDRLVLRPPIETDAEAIFHAYAQDPAVTRYLMWRPHRQVGDAQEYVQRCQVGWNDGTELTWILTRRTDQRVVGAIAIRPEGHKASLGYVLARAFWGQGLMPEAGRALIEAARTVDGLHRVWAVCDVDNHASARVLEKIGMQREGTLRRWVIHPNVSPLPRDASCYSWIRPIPDHGLETLSASTSTESPHR
jgi:ribosomal-protein-alanine N-acetyltransferase